MKFEFDSDTPHITVGSEADSDIRLDPHLNLNHAYIKLTEYGWTIQDNYSV